MDDFDHVLVAEPRKDALAAACLEAETEPRSLAGAIWASFRSGLLREIVGYGLVSAAALIADTWLLRFLVLDMQWHYVPASASSFISGAIIAYVLSIRFVFRSHRVTNRALEFGLFLAVGAVGLAVNTLILFLTYGLIGLGLITSKMLAAICTFVTNFLLRRGLLFTSPRRVQ